MGLGLLNFRLGALPEADSAARIALQVLQEGDFAPGLAFAATVLADIAAASGQLDEAEALLDLLPHGSLPPGVGTVLIPAGRGRVRLAQGRADEALAEFEACMALWRSDVWGMETRDVGYVHARSGAAETKSIRHLFLMTGASPHTQWLDGCVALDEKGFVKAGQDLLPDDLQRGDGFGLLDERRE